MLKPLSHRLELIKKALDNRNWVKAKQYAEKSVKNLNKYSASPYEKFLLYCRLSSSYSFLAEFSKALDTDYKAYIIASKNNIAPQYFAYVSSRMANNLSSISNFLRALEHYKKAEEYYQKYGDKRPPMDRQMYITNLVGQGFCYLNMDRHEELRELVEEKLWNNKPLETDEFALMNYHKFMGSYYVIQKDYESARQSFEELVKASEKFSFYSMMYDGKINLARIKLLQGGINESIVGLKAITKEVKRLVLSKQICDAAMLLSKCYLLNNMPDMAERIAKSIKPFLGKVDVTWLYEKNRQMYESYIQLRKIYKDVPGDNESLTKMISGVISHHYDKAQYRNIVIGESRAMSEIYQLIEKIAPTELPVLIQGETGTGKELIARAIYYNSARREKPWMALNCGAVAETLLESELFGHTKGSFTGAYSDKKGCIELASDGTLFLDEIAEMSPNMQHKLLRALEEKLIWRVGAQKPTAVNTRFVFASNQNIEKLVTAKRFRLDLFHRINTLIITLPPLRERKEDIPLLADYFLKKYAAKRMSAEGGSPPDGRAGASGGTNTQFPITKEALDLLINYNWSGNIRELENEIKRICALYQNINLITPEMISKNIADYAITDSSVVSEVKVTIKELTDDFHRKIIMESLEKHNNNMAKTAKTLGYSWVGLYKRMKQLNISVKAK